MIDSASEALDWARRLYPGAQIEEMHSRPWGRVFQMRSSSSQLWLKVNALDGPEAALLRTFERNAIDCTPKVVAAHQESGAFIMRDAGTSCEWSSSSAAFARILQEYAGLQLQTVSLRAEILASGVRALDFGSMQAAAANELEGYWHLLGVDASVAISRMHTWATRLAELGIPHAIQHDDLHSGNVLVDNNGIHSFIDWSDATFAHPFGSLIYPLDILSRGLPTRSSADRERRLALDSYLEPFTRYGDRRSLEESVTLATRLACIGRALVWHRLRPLIPPELSAAKHAYYVDGPSRWLRHLLNSR